MYTIKDYKIKLTAEHHELIESLFKNLQKSDNTFESTLLSTVQLLIQRNPQDNPINDGDFSFIMLIANDFDIEYQMWLLNKEKGHAVQNINGQLFLLAKNKKNLEILMEEIFSYFEHDVYKPQNILLEAVNEYEKTGAIDPLNRADYIYSEV